MKTLYFDSSYLFRIYSTEPGHQAVKSLLPGAKAIVSSWHARAEFSAILHRKKREGAMNAHHLSEIHRQFIDECEAGHLQLLPLSEAVIVRVENAFCTAPATLFLRAADALHLACAAEYGFEEIYSNDRQFLTAAPLFGLRGMNVIHNR